MTDPTRLSGWLTWLPTWWRLRLDAALPDRLRTDATPGSPERLLISLEEQTVTMALVGSDGREVFSERTSWSEYTRSKFDGCRRRAADLVHPRKIKISVALPQAVGRSMLIPRRARQQARQIVRDYISRKIPLPIEEIFIGWDLRVASAGKLTIQYIALPKTLLDRTFERLRVSGSDIATIEGQDTDAVPLAEPSPRRTSPQLRAWGALSAATVAVAVLGFGILAYRQNAVLTDLDAELQRLSGQARQSVEQARSIEKLDQDLATFATLRNVPSIGRIWENLAEELPTTSYLTELDITETGLQLSGFSESTPAIMRILESSAVVQQVSLAGPITFDTTKGRDRFSIQASLKVPRAPADNRD